MRRNRGFALAATMMVLALISVLGAMAIQSATLEVQISAHDRDARSALYVAEAGLEEARYYAARGWGNITAPTVTAPVPNPITVTVITDAPPAVPWGINQYVDFTLVDAAGRAFPINANSNTSPPTITLDTSAITSPDQAPTSGRFMIVRQLSSAWSWSDPDLTVPDDTEVWSINSGPNTWRGWTLYDDTGLGLTVTDSATDLTPAVVLTLSGDIAGFNFAAPMLRLGINPWLAAMEAGTVPAGDANGANGAVWDRVFLDSGGAEIGRTGVTVSPPTATGSPGQYHLISNGGAGTRHQTVQLTVFRAGSPTQGSGDWVIDDG